jgi:hypothetical protein
MLLETKKGHHSRVDATVKVMESPSHGGIRSIGLSSSISPLEAGRTSATGIGTRPAR